jgi:hypothetical protein
MVGVVAETLTRNREIRGLCNGEDGFNLGGGEHPLTNLLLDDFFVVGVTKPRAEHTPAEIDGPDVALLRCVFPGP